MTERAAALLDRLRAVRNAGQVAREMGSTRNWCSELAKRHGITLANRGRPRGRHEEVQKRNALVVARLRDGANGWDVVREFGIHRSTVTEVAKRAGIRLKTGRPLGYIPPPRQKQFRTPPKPSRGPRLWRCCGWLQQIPEGETARCGRCGTVPLFARPEPDLRQFRNGR